MPSARDFITSAMKRLTILAPGETPTPDDLTDGLVWLNRMIDAWGTQRLTIGMTQRFVHSLVSNQAAYTIGPGGDFDQPRPVWLQYVGLILNNMTPPIETPIDVLTVKDWTLQAIKAQTSTQPTQVYYNYNYPSTGVTAGMGQLEFWPVPTIAYDIAVYTPMAVAQFADLSTSYRFAPGYEKAIEYNLALELSEPWGQPVPPAVVVGATNALADIKRANIRLNDLSIDRALLGRGGIYDYRTDTVR
jgi:hypothetical protein